MHTPIFRDRRHAGQFLAEQLRSYAGQPDLAVLGVPRGGVPVAAEVAAALGAPLDVFIVRTLRVPSRPEEAMGAIAENGAQVLNGRVISAWAVAPHVIGRAAEHQAGKLQRLAAEYRDDRPRVAIAGKTIIVVDDGLETGKTMKGVVQALARERPGRIIAAVPVGTAAACDVLRAVVDELVCVHQPHDASPLAQWYQDFPGVTDAEIRSLLGHEMAGR